MPKRILRRVRGDVDGEFEYAGMYLEPNFLTPVTEDMLIDHNMSIYVKWNKLLTLHLSQARHNLAAAAAGNYIGFFGGSFAGGNSDAVDLFDVSTLTPEGDIVNKTMHLSQATYNLAAVANGNYIFAGGGAGNDSTVVDVFDISNLNTDGSPNRTLHLSQARYNLAAASAGNYIGFFGGQGTGTNIYDTADFFDLTNLNTNGTPNLTMKLSQARYDLVAASVGNYIVVGGGTVSGSVSSNVVDIFDVTQLSNGGNPYQVAQLSQARSNLAVAAAGNYVLFGGGHNNSDDSDVVDIFDMTNPSSTTPFKTMHLSQARRRLASVSNGNYVYFCGGDNVTTKYDVVDVFDISNLNVNGTPNSTIYLSEARSNLAAASNGDYVFVGGGSDISNDSVDIVDLIAVSNGIPQSIKKTKKDV